MRGPGFEPRHALSNHGLNVTRLTTPASPQIQLLLEKEVLCPNRLRPLELQLLRIEVIKKTIIPIFSFLRVPKTKIIKI